MEKMKLKKTNAAAPDAAQAMELHAVGLPPMKRAYQFSDEERFESEEEEPAEPFDAVPFDAVNWPCILRDYRAVRRLGFRRDFAIAQLVSRFEREFRRQLWRRLQADEAQRRRGQQ